MINTVVLEIIYYLSIKIIQFLIKTLNELQKDLQNRFYYLGSATVNHFLTDFAFPVIKPDRMIMRVLYRSHLVNNESVREYGKAILIGQTISKTLKLPIRYVDSVFVKLGMSDEAEICKKNKPDCNICDLRNICKYYK